jgi:hypothetical protein
VLVSDGDVRIPKCPYLDRKDHPDMSLDDAEWRVSQAKEAAEREAESKSASPQAVAKAMRDLASGVLEVIGSVKGVEEG